MSSSSHLSRLAAVAMAAAAFLAITGCGGNSDPLASMSAKQVAAKAIADLKTAPKFTINGSGRVMART